MNNTWSLHDAKNRFSEVVDRSVREGPQVIARRGSETAVVISCQMFKTLARREGSLVDFMRRSPLVGEDLDLSRSLDSGRDIGL